VRHVIDIVLPGDMIGLAAAVLGTVKHSVEALTPVTLCVLDSRALTGLFGGHPALALLRTRVEEEHRADIRLALLGCRTAAPSARFPCGGATSTPPPGSRGCTSRALEELKSAGLAEVQSGVLTLADRPRLVELAGYALPTRAAGMRAIL
jgi:CRP-like cAMP-binding protein